MKEKFTGKNKDLQNEIDLYLKCISKSALVFFEGSKEAIRGDYEDVKLRLQEISEIEREADSYLKSIVFKLYAYNITPDSRADVFELLDGMDDIVDYSKKILFQISVEKPGIPESLKEDFTLIAEASLDGIDLLVQGVRAFFEDINTVDGYVDKVYLHEKEADKLEEKIKRNAFQSGEIKDLSVKFQIRYFVEQMALLSDVAEEIAKNLLLYKMRRVI